MDSDYSSDDFGEAQLPESPPKSPKERHPAAEQEAAQPGSDLAVGPAESSRQDEHSEQGTNHLRKSLDELDEEAAGPSDERKRCKSGSESSDDSYSDDENAENSQEDLHSARNSGPEQAAESVNRAPSRSSTSEKQAPKQSDSSSEGYSRDSSDDEGSGLDAVAKLPQSELSGSGQESTTQAPLVKEKSSTAPIDAASDSSDTYSVDNDDASSPEASKAASGADIGQNVSPTSTGDSRHEKSDSNRSGDHPPPASSPPVSARSNRSAASQRSSKSVMRPARPVPAELFVPRHERMQQVQQSRASVKSPTRKLEVAKQDAEKFNAMLLRSAFPRDPTGRLPMLGALTLQQEQDLYEAVLAAEAAKRKERAAQAEASWEAWLKQKTENGAFRKAQQAQVEKSSQTKKGQSQESHDRWRAWREQKDREILAAKLEAKKQEAQLREKAHAIKAEQAAKLAQLRQELRDQRKQEFEASIAAIPKRTKQMLQSLKANPLNRPAKLQKSVSTPLFDPLPIETPSKSQKEPSSDPLSSTMPNNSVGSCELRTSKSSEQQRVGRRKQRVPRGLLAKLIAPKPAWEASTTVQYEVELSAAYGSAQTTSIGAKKHKKPKADQSECKSTAASLEASDQAVASEAAGAAVKKHKRSKQLHSKRVAGGNAVDNSPFAQPVGWLDPLTVKAQLDWERNHPKTIARILSKQAQAQGKHQTNTKKQQRTDGLEAPKTRTKPARTQHPTKAPEKRRRRGAPPHADALISPAEAESTVLLLDRKARRGAAQHAAPSEEERSTIQVDSRGWPVMAASAPSNVEQTEPHWTLVPRDAIIHRQVLQVDVPGSRDTPAFSVSTPIHSRIQRPDDNLTITGVLDDALVPQHVRDQRTAESSISRTLQEVVVQSTSPRKAHDQHDHDAGQASLTSDETGSDIENIARELTEEAVDIAALEADQIASAFTGGSPMVAEAQDKTESPHESQVLEPEQEPEHESEHEQEQEQEPEHEHGHEHEHEHEHEHGQEQEQEHEHEQEQEQEHEHEHEHEHGQEQEQEQEHEPEQELELEQEQEQEQEHKPKSENQNQNENQNEGNSESDHDRRSSFNDDEVSVTEAHEPEGPNAGWTSRVSEIGSSDDSCTELTDEESECIRALAHELVEGVVQALPEQPTPPPIPSPSCASAQDIVPTPAIEDTDDEKDDEMQATVKEAAYDAVQAILEAIIEPVEAAPRDVEPNTDVPLAVEEGDPLDLRTWSPNEYAEITSPESEARWKSQGGAWPPESLIRVFGAINILLHEKTTWRRAKETIASDELVDRLQAITPVSVPDREQMIVSKLIVLSGGNALMAEVEALDSKPAVALTHWLLELHRRFPEAAQPEPPVASISQASDIEATVESPMHMSTMTSEDLATITARATRRAWVDANPGSLWPPRALVCELGILTVLLREPTTWRSAELLLEAEPTVERIRSWDPRTFTPATTHLVNRLMSGDPASFQNKVHELGIPAASALADHIVELHRSLPPPAPKPQPERRESVHTAPQAAASLRRLTSDDIKFIGSRQMKRDVQAAGNQWPPLELTRLMGGLSFALKEPATWRSAMQLINSADLVARLERQKLSNLTTQEQVTLRKILQVPGGMQAAIKPLKSPAADALALWLELFSLDTDAS